MRIAVTGTTGRVGAALVKYFSASHQVVPLPRQICDLADPRSLSKALDRLECDVFINPAAVTSLEVCEDSPTLAMRVNAEAPAEIAAWASRRGVRLVHFSTDYVFGGESEGLLNETDVPCPVNVYGQSKLAGELSVLSSSQNSVIRVSWVFGPEKPSFIDQIFHSALAGERLAAVVDKFSLPLYTLDLADWAQHLVEHKSTGIFHACHSGEPVSWHGIATVVVEEMAKSGVIRKIPIVEKKTLSEMTSFRALRPCYTAMSTYRLSEVLGHPPRPWRVALSEYIRQQISLL